MKYQFSVCSALLTIGLASNLMISEASALSPLIIDNTDVRFTASTSWVTATSAADKYGSNYRYRQAAAVMDTANYSFKAWTTGPYEISVWWTSATNRSTRVPYMMPNGAIVYRNQQYGGGMWNSLGVYNLSSTQNNTVKVSCWTTAGFVVVADALKAVPR